MVETADHLVTRLAEEGEKTRLFFERLSAQQLEQPIYAEGSAWTAQQILAHFVSTEAAMLTLIRTILAGGPGAPADFSIDSFNEAEVTALKVVAREELLQRFDHLRHQMIALVSGLSPMDLQRIGRHPFLGEAPLAEIIKLVYRHNQIHQRDIRRQLDNTGGEPGV